MFQCASCLSRKAPPSARFLSSPSSPAPQPSKEISQKARHHKQPITRLKSSYGYGAQSNGITVLGLFLVGASSWAGWNYFDEEKKIFNPPQFTPFQITFREEVSPTSIILTVRPPQDITNIGADPYEKWWKTGTWSVEVKQPQLQIARSYTPLPPREGDAPGTLRFLIRKEKNGEVSGYLHRLQVGGTVELRGPRTEIELVGNVKEVVFLAGGTGIAPALQVVHTLLERRGNGEGSKGDCCEGGNEDMANIRIVWANRRREDCIGGGFGVKDAPNANYIVRELEELKRKYPENLKVAYMVDEEGAFLDQKQISKLLKSGSEVKYGPTHTRIDSRLLILSGPEGFINFFAGPKKWEGGREGQGELGGVIGAMRLRDWKVWKL